MRIFKKIIIVLIVIIALAAIIGMFMPSAAHIERSMIMKAPAENIFYQVNELKNWNNWMPFNKMDPKMKINWGEKTSGEGAEYSWESDNSNVGKGSVQITKSVPIESVQTALHFEGMPGAGSTYKLEKMNEGTKVTWSFDGSMGSNPFKRLMGPMMDKMLGNIFEKGLKDLDSAASKIPAPVGNNIKLEMTTLQPMNYLAVHDTASMSTIGQKLGMYYGMIQATMKKQKLNFAGSPFAIYYTESPTNWEMDAAIPVDKQGKADGKVHTGQMKAGNALVAHHYGAYDKTSEAYKELHSWIVANNKKITGAPWEVYVTDPSTEKDTAKWLTNVYFPVE